MLEALGQAGAAGGVVLGRVFALAPVQADRAGQQRRSFLVKAAQSSVARAGWPDAKVLETSRYFDAMNFAARTKADALVSVGFIDGICRPTSVYAAYNDLPGKKEMLNKPLMNHAVAPEWDAMVLAKVKEQIANRK